jgi:Biotin protein ligase C terminal domain
LKPIEWTQRRTRADPARRARELLSDRPRGGVVFFEEPPRDEGLLRFSAVAACGRETPLLMRLIAAFSASEGIRKDTGIISWVRWPGEVTIRGLRVAASSACVTRRPGGGWAQLDFRVNIQHSGLPGSTSLYDELGVEVDRKLLLEKTLESLSWMHFGWSNGMHPQLLIRVRSMTETIGSRVRVRDRGQSSVGSAVDVDTLGRLLVRLDDGRTRRLGEGEELLEE